MEFSWYSVVLRAEPIWERTLRYKSDSARSTIAQPEGPSIATLHLSSPVHELPHLPNMFSFMKIATFAALTFGTFASAIPSPAPAAEARDLEARAAGVTLTSLLTQLPNQVSGSVSKLNALTPETATPAAVAAIAAEIKVQIDATVGAIVALPVGAIGTGNILVLLSAFIQVVLGAFVSVYSLPGVDVVAIKAAIKVSIDVSLSVFISVVLNLVVGILGSLLVSLKVLLGVYVSVFLELDLTACIGVLVL